MYYFGLKYRGKFYQIFGGFSFEFSEHPVYAISFFFLSPFYPHHDLEKYIPRPFSLRIFFTLCISPSFIPFTSLGNHSTVLISNHRDSSPETDSESRNSKCFQRSIKFLTLQSAFISTSGEEISKKFQKVTCPVF